MGKGRKPDPPRLRLLKGKDVRRVGAASAAAPREIGPDDIPVAPPELDDEERGYFDLVVGRLVEEQLASRSHTEVVALAAKRMAEIVALSNEIRSNGYTYWSESTDGGAPLLKPNPAVRMRSEAQRHLHSLLAELGLTPVAQSKVGGGAKGASDSNPFARFLERR